MTDVQLAKGLGWFSIGLGLTELLAPGWLGRKIGLGERTGLLRAFGAREAITGIGVLAQRRPALGLWGRVAGDVLDAAVLTSALRSSGDGRRGRLAGSLGAVAGVTLLDVACARMLQRG
jgi:hypothetical protein